MDAILGMLVFSLGGLAGATFLLPARGIKGWAYESWWLVYAFIGLIVCPPVICYFTVPDFWRVAVSAPAHVLLRCIAFGMMWGVGALAWGLMVRYLGIGLGLAFGCGLCAATGTLIPPIAAGRAADLVKDAGSVMTLAGVMMSLAGMVFVGFAGKLKEGEMPDEAKRKAVAEFDFRKGIVTAVVAGLFSAGMNFGLQGAESIERAAVEAGARECWRGMPVIMVVLWGGFAVELMWCVWRNWRNRTFGDYARISPRNLLLCAAVGGIWVMQFVCTKAGEPMMGDMKYISFAVMMASTILFSTAIGAALGEWRGVRPRTKVCLAFGTFVMAAGFCLISVGAKGA